VYLIVVIGLAFLLLTLLAFRTFFVPLKSIIGFLLSVLARSARRYDVPVAGEHILGITRARRSASCRCSCWRYLRIV